jgi:glycogen(starch) synthase
MTVSQTLLHPAPANRRAAPPRAQRPPLGICLISEELPPETGWGGIGTYSHNLARGLVALGHRVHVIARCWGKDRTDVIDGVVVHRLALAEPSWRWGTWFINLRFPEARQIVLWNARVSRLLGELRDREQIDIVETPEYHAQGLAASMMERDLPLIVRLHTPAFLCRELNGSAIGGSEWDTNLSEHLEYRLARRATLVTAPSRHMAGVVARAWKLDPAKMRVIANPIDDDRFAPTAGDPPQRDEQTMLFVGRLERRKGVDAIARALPLVRERFPRARVKLIGNDHPSAPGGISMKAHLQVLLRQSRTPADAMEFVGPIDRTLLPAEYQRSAICLAPSLYESFGYTCVEAMAAGCAVIAARAGALPEIVTDDADGLLVPPDDPPALAAAMVRLLESRELRERLAEQARRTVAGRFSRDAVCAQMAELYRSVIA